MKRIQHCLQQSKELTMNANVYDEDRAPDRSQREGLGKTKQPKAPAKAGSAKGLVAALLLVSAIPLANGAFRLIQLAGGAEITPANARFFAAPLPVVLHTTTKCRPRARSGVSLS